ncbi:uncharacterized protein FFC1_01941 [Fusarium fujikuroi]|nr:uncharacterized protein FFC1_01941 [Fusarium fujikuroi]
MVHLVNPERLPEEIPDYSRFAMYYLRALFTTIPISQFAHTTNFEPIQGRKDDKESFEIRHRPTTSEPAEGTRVDLADILQVAKRLKPLSCRIFQQLDYEC